MKKTVPFLFLFFSLQILFAQTAPTAANDTFTINKNNQVLLPVLANDFDLDGDPIALSVLSTPAHGTASIAGNQIQYLPNFNYVGNDQADYIICDTTGRCDTAVVLIIITGFNNAPVAANDTYTINKNNQVLFPVLANDFDPDGDPVHLSVLSSPAHGVASIVGSQIQYLPDFNYVGNDQADYIVCDNTGLCDTAQVFIIITGFNNGPVANNDTFSIPENSVTFLPVTSNDYDPDGDPLSISILTSAQHGSTVITNGTQVIYTPAQFYFGVDSFSYVLCENTGLCDTAVVYLLISGSNAAPVAVDDNFVFTDTVNATALNVLANDYDVENDSFFVVSVIDIDSNNNLGTLNIMPNGEVVFARVPLACGNETFEYVLCQVGGCDTGQITITINCPDKVFLPQGFSPDGDGKNDHLVFTGLEYFAPAALKVFNRYGTLVYDNPDYQNDWDGSNMDSNKALPDGTYFYVLELGDKKKYNSYLIINR